MQIQIDANFIIFFGKVKPMYAQNTGFTFETVTGAVGNIADKFFFVDRHGVIEIFGNVNLFAANFRFNIFNNRINNHVNNFLRIFSRLP